jgi:two-component system copper resistance phosphate regulon response regulator CusR
MRILVVEDEIKLAKAIQRALQLQKHIVDIVHDGEKGLDLASEDQYDLIILDVMLPKLSGMDVCTQLRAQKIDTPLLMLTANGQVSDKTAGLDAGADDYMVKPFSFEELFSRIRALVRRANKQGDTLLRVDGLSLDPATFKVKREGKLIELSAKEFAVLEYLMRNKNKVLSKQQIVNHVWDYDTDVLPSTVEVHIKNLRDKVDKPFHTALIFTVRGFGYEIRDEK